MEKKKVLLIADAWRPQVNGVVTTLENVTRESKKQGVKTLVFHPGRCKTRFKLYFYPEIEIGFPNPILAYKLVKNKKWAGIHISSPESPMGFTFSSVCTLARKKYNTAYHTKLPEFIKERFKIFPIELGYRWMKWCHKNSNRILATTQSVKDELNSRGFKNTQVWCRGVDRDIFYPIDKLRNNSPILVCVSRVSTEKNLEDFFKIDLPYRKIMVGDGPELALYKKKYPEVEFVGKKKGSELAHYYQIADAFIFPSKLDTFGVVIIEALACGTPVVAYPVTGPIDIVKNGVSGILTNDLKSGVERALLLDRNEVYEESLVWTWEKTTEIFLSEFE